MIVRTITHKAMPTSSRTQKGNKNTHLRKYRTTIFVTIGICCLVAFSVILSRESTSPASSKSIFSSYGLKRKGPFPMPIRGEHYEIFQPVDDIDVDNVPQLIAPAKDFISTFKKHIEWVNPLVRPLPNSNMKTDSMTPEEHAKYMYIEMMKSYVSAVVFNDAEMSIWPRLGQKQVKSLPFNLERRIAGEDWVFKGDTMIGWKRLDNIRDLIQDVVQQNIKGDYIETGVWRGGASIFARAVLAALDETENRVSYVCDSFRGLPPGDKKLHDKDKGWDTTSYLEVSSEIVASNFQQYGLLDPNVVFVKGFFNETMPPLSEKIETLSIMRLDGDMYESTVDVLYHLYDKLSVGGYVIIDDWDGYPSKVAVEDFFEVHNISPEIIPIDNQSAYWRKGEQIDIQYWRYKQSKFTK